MRLLPCLAVVGLLCATGCNRGAASAHDRIAQMRFDIIAGRWLDLAQYISPNNTDGFALKPKEVAAFLQAYANVESRGVVFRAFTPSKIDPKDADSAKDQTVYLQVIRGGYPTTDWAITARHAGGDTWVVQGRDLAEGLLGILHPDFDERYRCMRKALLAAHIPMYGRRGHYTTPDRIQAYLDGRIGRDRLYSADPAANPV